VDKWIGMARDRLCDPHRAVIAGPSRSGQQVESPDIRAGMAMALAALASQGDSVFRTSEERAEATSTSTTGCEPWGPRLSVDPR